eukprot:1212504-Prymnesium_polylepis.2
MGREMAERREEVYRVNVHRRRAMATSFELEREMQAVLEEARCSSQKSKSRNVSFFEGAAATPGERGDAHRTTSFADCAPGGSVRRASFPALASGRRFSLEGLPSSLLPTRLISLAHLSPRRHGPPPRPTPFSVEGYSTNELSKGYLTSTRSRRSQDEMRAYRRARPRSNSQMYTNIMDILQATDTAMRAIGRRQSRAAVSSSSRGESDASAPQGPKAAARSGVRHSKEAELPKKSRVHPDDLALAGANTPSPMAILRGSPLCSRRSAIVPRLTPFAAGMSPLGVRRSPSAMRRSVSPSSRSPLARRGLILRPKPMRYIVAANAGTQTEWTDGDSFKSAASTVERPIVDSEDSFRSATSAGTKASSCVDDDSFNSTASVDSLRRPPSMG